MEKKSLPRFKRTAPTQPIQLTPRDGDIIQIIHRHRFLRSSHITKLLGGSEQQIIRRLQLLFHHGYLERPRAQLKYFGPGGSQPIAYGLGRKGGAWLRRQGRIAYGYLWSEKNHDIGRVYLNHTLLVADIMVAVELACRQRGIRLLYENDLSSQPFHWWVRLVGGMKLGVMPDRVFAIEYTDATSQTRYSYFFLEADRGTMPVIRNGLAQTSFFRKLLAYEATWANKVHKRHLGIHNFRVLTVTTIATRVQSLLNACSQLKRGHGLFLFADTSVLVKNLFAPVLHDAKTGQLAPLLDLKNLKV